MPSRDDKCVFSSIYEKLNKSFGLNKVYMTAAEEIKVYKTFAAIDLLAHDFTVVLSQHTTYVIVGGYIAILFGSARACNDVDIIIPFMDISAFSKLHKAILAAGFESSTGKDVEDTYYYITNQSAIRYTRPGEQVPDIELKFAKTHAEYIALQHPRKVRFNNHTLLISPLELQIAFKEKSSAEKDLKDAKYIRNTAKPYIDESLIAHYSKNLHQHISL